MFGGIFGGAPPPEPPDNEDRPEEYYIQQARHMAGTALHNLVSAAPNHAFIPRSFFIARRMAIAMLAQEMMNMKSGGLPYASEEYYLREITAAVSAELKLFEIQEAEELLKRGAEVN